MKILNNFIDFILNSLKEYSPTEIRNGMVGFAIFIFIFLIGGIYYISTSTQGLIKKIKIIESQIEEASKLQQINNEILKQEEEEQAFLANNQIPNGLKAFIEQKAATTFNIDAGWKESSKITKWFLDDLFEEEKLSLSLKSISTKQLAEFIQLIYSAPAIAIRELSINKGNNDLAIKVLLSYRYKKT